jgi:glutaminyl-peptide cyclotransferase
MSEGIEKHFVCQNRRWAVFALILLTVILGPSCSARQMHVSLPETLTPLMTYEVMEVYPHDPQAFTQGLIYRDGFLYESTGRYGESSLRKVDLDSGQILQQVNLDPDFFGEGLTDWDDRLIQLTWREGLGLIYNIEEFSLLGQFNISTEGWGLTQDGEQLIMSDGSSSLYFLNPETFEVTGTVTVADQGYEINQLNELEYIRGQVFANIWQTNDIIRIDPDTGEVLGWIDLSGILPEEARTETTNVLNGIAYDSQGDRLFVTGKYWPYLYEIRLIPITNEED